MSRQRICSYGSCESDDIRVTVNIKLGNWREAFCCEEHAALWLLKKAEREKAWREVTFIEIGGPT